MRFTLITFVLTLLAAYTMAVTPALKAVIISYSDDTPDDIIASAKQAIIDAVSSLNPLH